jgi:sugar O-acyltransferase (sialic acid O-acetyltransferase NeuD family)
VTLLWGSGGHAKVVMEVAAPSLRSEAFVFVDDDPSKIGGRLDGHPICSFAEAAQRATTFLVCIGNNRMRAERFAEAVDKGLTPLTVVHPSAIISETAVLSSGTVVMPRVVINAGASVGADCIVNSGAIIEHDCTVGDHAHISPGAVLGGGVCIGRYVHVGLNASVLPGVSIGEGAVVGAGAVVLRDVPPGVIVAGVPAKNIQKV